MDAEQGGEAGEDRAHARVLDRLVELAQCAAEDRSHFLCGVRQLDSLLLWIGSARLAPAPPRHPACGSAPGRSPGIPVFNRRTWSSTQPAHANSRRASDCACSASSVATAAVYASTSPSL